MRGLRFGFLAFHWGAEYVSVPQSAEGIAPDDPVEIAHLAVDAGADFIIGNHPHWVQAVELYRGKLIVYAHGNYIFDQMWSYETRVGVIGLYTFYDDKLVRVEFIPTIIEDYAQPRLLSAGEAGGPGRDEGGQPRAGGESLAVISAP